MSDVERAGEPRIAAGYTATVKKRSLGALFVRLREEAGLNFSDASRDARISPTTLRQMELGQWVRSISDHARALCELCGVSEDVKAEILQIAYEAHEPGWWRAKRFKGIFGHELPGFEAGASLIRTFAPQYVPGLLQAPGYIELVTRVSGITDSDEVERHVAARLQRQEILTRTEHPVKVHAVIDAASVLRVPDDIREEQVRHLLTAGERPNVTLQAIPVATGVYAGMGEPFTHMSFDDAEAGDLIFIETTVDDRFLEREEEIAAYTTRFDGLRDVALTPEATHEFLQQQIG